MRKSSLITKITIFIILVFSSYLFAQDKTMTISGTVEALEETDEGLVTKVAIVVDTGSENEDEAYLYYVVVDDKKSQPLLNSVGELVEATGKVHNDKEEGWMIKISSFKILPMEFDNTDPEEEIEDEEVN